MLVDIESDLCGRLHGRAYLTADKYLSQIAVARTHICGGMTVAGDVLWHVDGALPTLASSHLQALSLSC